MPASYTSYNSRIPWVMTMLEHRADQVAEKAAEKIVERAKEAVPVESGRLKESIHAEHTDVMEWTVYAGDESVWYGHLVEHGTNRMGARPFLLPAAEATENEINQIGLEVMDGLA